MIDNISFYMPFLLFVYLEPKPGLEPGTYSLRMSCSTS